VKSIILLVMILMCMAMTLPLLGADYVLVDNSKSNGEVYSVSIDDNVHKLVANDIVKINPNRNGVSFYETTGGNFFVGDILESRTTHWEVLFQEENITGGAVNYAGNQLLITGKNSMSLYSVSEKECLLKKIWEDEVAHSPSWSPDGKTIAYYSETNGSKFRLATIHTQDEIFKELVTEASLPIYLSLPQRPNPPLWSADSNFIFHQFRKRDVKWGGLYVYSVVDRKNSPSPIYSYYSDRVKLAHDLERIKIKMIWEIGKEKVQREISALEIKTLRMLPRSEKYLKLDNFGVLSICDSNSSLELFSLKGTPSLHFLEGSRH